MEVTPPRHHFHGRSFPVCGDTAVSHKYCGVNRRQEVSVKVKKHHHCFQIIPCSPVRMTNAWSTRPCLQSSQLPQKSKESSKPWSSFRMGVVAIQGLAPGGPRTSPLHRLPDDVTLTILRNFCPSSVSCVSV
ncbi:hypothetical protein J6590_043692 [Homalodisca vitripennis]|nr:hypothetical protein J6590_043692 [Homalodisca vitripennis]